MPNPQESLADKMARLMATTATISPEATPIAQPTLADSMSQLDNTMKQTSPAVDKELFEKRKARMQTPIIAAPGQAAKAAALGTVSGFVKGLFSPISTFMPDAFNDQMDLWEEDSARKMLGLQAKSQFKSTYAASPSTSQFLASGPSKAGELGGSLIPFIGTYGKARQFFEVGKAANITAEVARGMLAGASTGGILAAAAQLDPGESRWSKVATDAAAMGAFEMVGIPSMMKAWKEESPGLAEGVAKELGASAPTVDTKVAEKVDAQLTAIRAGVPASDDTIDAVLNVAKDNPELQGKPIVLQAAKQKEAKQKLTSPATTIDPILALDNSTNLKARVTVNVNGQPAMQKDFIADPKNPQALPNQIADFKKQLQDSLGTGADISVANIHAGSPEDAQAVLNELQGKTQKPASLDKKKRKVPGAAPVNSVAENGTVPTEGQSVNIAEPGKPIISGKVAKLTPLPSQQAGLDSLDALQKAMYGEEVPTVGNGLLPAAPPAISEPAAAPAVNAPKAKPAGKLTKEQKADKYAREVEAAQQSTVPVELPDKTIRVVPLAQLQMPLEMGMASPKDVLKPHLNGDTRHGIIHLDSGEVSFEPLGANQDPNQNTFRSEIFSSTDPTIPYGKDPRLFIDKDGVTIRPQPLTNKSLDVGSGLMRWKEDDKNWVGLDNWSIDDTEEVRQNTDVLGDARKMPFRSNTFKEVFSGATVPTYTGPKGLDESLRVLRPGETLTLRPFNDDLPAIKKWAKQRSNAIADIQYGPGPNAEDTWVTVKKAGAPLELVTMKKSANILMKQGVRGDTLEKSTGKTLKQLSEMELPLADMQELKDAAAERGLKVTPFGAKVTLQSKGGFSRTFANSLEAHAAVLSIPTSKVDQKIEGALEQAWKMGSERAYDPDVDVTRYLPAAVQEQGITELATGKRPLVPVYTKDAKALTSTIRQLETALNVPENTFQVQLLPAMDNDGRKAAVLYNRDAIALSAAKNRASLNYLGVTAKEPSAILQQLSQKGKGHGIFVLSGRDAESAALYAHWRETGAKELWEKGRIETDTLGPYRRFSKDAKQVISYPGAGDESYTAKDIADFMHPPEGVSFAADSGAKPRMAEEMAPYEPDASFGKEPPRWDRKNLPDEGAYDTSGPLAKVFGQRLRPMMELSKDLQVRTGVPFYEWYRAIEVGRNKVDQITNPLLSYARDLAKPLTRAEREQVQLLFESRIGGAEDVAALEKKLNPAVANASTKLQEMYSKFFQQEGFGEKDVKDFFSIFPNIRKADGDFNTAIGGKGGIPKIGQLLSKDLQNGVINVDGREFDFQKIANRIIRSTATERYLQPSWQRVATELDAYAQAKRIPNDTAGIFTRYMSEVLHMPDDLQKSLGRAVRQTFAKLGGRISEVESQDAVSMLTQMNSFSNMAWNPGIVLRNFLQTLQTSLPIVGVNDTLEGWRFGVKWWKDKGLQEMMVKRGVVNPEGIYSPMQEISKVGEIGHSGAISKGFDIFFNQGTRWNATTDDFNKVVAFHSQYTRAKRFGQQYLDGKIDMGTFLEKSKIDMRDAPNGPFIQEVKQAMLEKNLEKAASRAGEEFAKSTQFQYTRGNAPYAMQSTMGRFLLQYGTWPAWYAENLRNIAARGSYKNRMIAATQWVGVQSAMFGTANALFGVDLARWTFFSPLGYTGGPFMQMGIQGMQTLNSAVDPSSNDPIARIAKARLAQSVVKQVTPLPIGAATHVIKSMMDLSNGRWQDSARNLLGLPAAKGPLF